MKLNDVIKIAVLPGDGIGADVMFAALPVFDALNIPVQLTVGDIGWRYWCNEGNAIPERTWQLIGHADTVLLGATTSKPAREAQQELIALRPQTTFEYVSPIIQLRQQLDLFANVRPCFSVLNESKPFNLAIIRENTEGLYSGFDYAHLPPEISTLLAHHPKWQHLDHDEVSCTLRLQSKAGLLRLFDYAFQYAEQHHLTRVTLADKPNVLRHSSGIARDLFERVAQRYPAICADILNVDAVALWLIRRPEQFGVIVAENMFGDILSDVGAGIMGGLGLAPSANIGHKGCYFEPVHGSAPGLATNSANPSAMFLTISLLLNHFGYYKPAQTLVAALTKVVNDQRYVTYDLGGNSSTTEMAKAIIDQCLALPVASSTPFALNTNDLPQQLDALRAFSTAELSDALDGCGINGALLAIKPLLPGQKIIGLAYTIGYAPYDEKPHEFKSAADYIDAVPPGSVIMIDNQGQTDCSCWGGILTQVAQDKGIVGTVVHGAVRDRETIERLHYPVYCTGVVMRSGKNRIYKACEQQPLTIAGVVINPGDVMVADDNGVLVIPINAVKQIIDYATNIQQTEQKIIAAVKEGTTLAEARKTHHYDRPWL